MLYETLCEQGERAFRWRGAAPALLLVPAVLLTLFDTRYLFNDHDLDQFWDCFALLLMLAGLGIRVWTTGHTPRRTSGRNTKGQVADTLNTSGAYSLVRNPLYVGNFIGGLGAVLLLHSFGLTLYYVLAFAIYFERVVLAEERFLTARFGDAYTRWARKTPAFLPEFSGYLPAVLPFSWRAVVRREYLTVFMAVFIIFIIEVGEDTVNQGTVVIDQHWLLIAAINSVLFMAIRWIRKRTRWLSAQGR